tara:strand:- start:465 stop:1175 length:711 start_codon:yes stop_codon:yes gene_type:complete
MNNTFYFKGIKFYNNDFLTIIKELNIKKGYLVAPAASALAMILKNKDFHLSLKKSSIAILDSGFFCILIRIFYSKKVTKFSGYLFIKKFVESNLKIIKKQSILSINPNKIDEKINNKLLRKKKFIKVYSYSAPIYKSIIKDTILLDLITKKKPGYILINIGGETQERLALYIVKKLKFKNKIICTGAAIAFLTGRQAPINSFIDKLYLGWLIRLIHNPKEHFVRSLKSLKLIKLFI